MWKHLDVNYPLFLSDLNENLISRRIFQNKKVSSFMNIRQVGAELFHADRRTDMTKLIVAFRNFRRAPKIVSLFPHIRAQDRNNCTETARTKQMNTDIKVIGQCQCAWSVSAARPSLCNAAGGPITVQGASGWPVWRRGAYERHSPVPVVTDIRNTRVSCQPSASVLVTRVHVFALWANVKWVVCCLGG